MSQSPVAAWTLKPTNSTPAEYGFAITPSVSGGTGETSLRDDSRKPVKPSDFQPGGKYYSIVKLQIRYEGQDSSDTRYAQGTGWLIQPDLLVTAGHCAFDHLYSLGKAVEVKAYLGYNGRSSIGKPGVQFRSGSRLVTTKEWIASDVNRANDVSFIQLNAAFDNVVPFVWRPTPEKGQAVRLGVVGYPADKMISEEPAAQMYEMFAATSWDLSASASQMLEYKISSYAGQSGSPVFVDSSNRPLVSYGAHVYGLGTKNSASVIKGVHGNNYKAIISAFKKTFPPPGADIASISVDDEEFDP